MCVLLVALMISLLIKIKRDNKQKCRKPGRWTYTTCRDASRCYKSPHLRQVCTAFPDALNQKPRSSVHGLWRRSSFCFLHFFFNNLTYSLWILIVGEDDNLMKAHDLACASAMLRAVFGLEGTHARAHAIHHTRAAIMPGGSSPWEQSTLCSAHRGVLH